MKIILTKILDKKVYPINFCCNARDLARRLQGSDIMENPANQITVYPAKIVEGRWAALALIEVFGAETLLATRRILLTQSGK